MKTDGMSKHNIETFKSIYEDINNGIDFIFALHPDTDDNLKQALVKAFDKQVIQSELVEPDQILKIRKPEIGTGFRIKPIWDNPYLSERGIAIAKSQVFFEVI